MMDCFSPTFSKVLSEHKKSKKRDILIFYSFGLTLFLSSRVFLSGIKMGVISV